MGIIELIINQYGLSIGLIIGFLFIIGKTSKYIAVRCFDKDTGIFTKVAEKHIEVMTSISDIQSEQHIELIDVKQNLAELILIYKDKYSNLSNHKLHSCGLVACDVLEDISDGIEIEDTRKKVKENLRKIRIILSNGT